LPDIHLAKGLISRYIKNSKSQTPKEIIQSINGQINEIDNSQKKCK
jgi:hypothetical protein